MKRWHLAVLACVALLWVGCAPPPAIAPEGTPPIPIPKEARRWVDLARQELAKRLRVLDEAIDLIDVEATEWPTAAMGCPKPGETYADVVTPGYRIRFRVQGRVYEVHVSKRGEVRLCPPQEEKGEAMQVPQGAQQAVLAAKRDMASRLGVPIEEVRVVQVEAVEWPDASLGCPEPGKMYIQVITPGYRIVLQAAGKTFEYHTDRGSRAVLCGAQAKPAKPALRRPSLMDVRHAIERSRADLARRKGVDEQSITVVEAAQVQNLASPVPCPPAEKLATLAGPEYQVTLALQGETYVYRVRGDAVVLCR